MNLTVRQIVIQYFAIEDEVISHRQVGDVVALYLDDHDYDGLYWDEDADGCSCFVGDLAPCGSNMSECRAGYKNQDENYQDGDGYIGPDRPTIPI